MDLSFWPRSFTITNMTTEQRSSPLTVSERLPSGYFGRLATDIRVLGELAVPALLAHPMAPSLVMADPLEVGSTQINLSFEYRMHPETADPVATHYTAVISDKEPYLPDPNGQVCTWLSFQLDLRRRRKVFDKGTSIVFPDGEIFLTDQPPLGQSRRSPPIWKQAQQLGKLCTREDLRWFTERLHFAHRHFRRAQLQ